MYDLCKIVFDKQRFIGSDGRNSVVSEIQWFESLFLASLNPKKAAAPPATAAILLWPVATAPIDEKLKKNEGFRNKSNK